MIIRTAFLLTAPDPENRQDRKWAEETLARIAQSVGTGGWFPHVPGAVAGGILEADPANPLRMRIRRMSDGKMVEFALDASGGHLRETGVVPVPSGPLPGLWKPAGRVRLPARNHPLVFPMVSSSSDRGEVRVTMPIRLLTPDLPSDARMHEGPDRPGSAASVTEVGEKHIGWIVHPIPDGVLSGGFVFSTITLVYGVFRVGDIESGSLFLYSVIPKNRRDGMRMEMVIHPRRNVDRDWRMVHQAIAAMRERLLAASPNRILMLEVSGGR